MLSHASKKRGEESTNDDHNTNCDPDNDVAGSVARLNALDPLHHLHLLKPDFVLLQPVLLFPGQHKSHIGDVSDPSTELGAVQEVYFDWAVRRNAADLLFDSSRR